MSGDTRLDDAIEALRAQHAPDPRLAVWDVEAEDDPAGRRLAGAVSVPTAIPALRSLAAEAGIAFAVDPLPDLDVDSAVRGVVHRSLAHVRAGPGHATELVTQLALGEEVLVLREREEWLQAQGADDYIGWIHRGSLLRSRPSDPVDYPLRLRAREPDPGTWIVVARAALARLEPGRHAPPVADLVEGGRVRRAGDAEREWTPIELPDGTVGWVPGGTVVPVERLHERFSPGGRAILDHAAQYLGLPYLWGGTTEKGFDCSGIVQRLYGLHGTRLPRDADQQAGVGPAVDLDDDWNRVADGDLAFFSERPGRVTHVGILAEGGRMIHASTSNNGVAWNALAPDDPDRTPYGNLLESLLIEIRRPLAG